MRGSRRFAGAGGLRRPVRGGRRRRAAFALSDVDGLIAHYNPLANLVSESGGDISQVDDSYTVDTTDHMTQGTDANQPTYNSTDAGVNGRPSVKHTASNTEHLSATDRDPGTDFVFTFAAAKFRSGGDFHALLSKMNTGAGEGFVFGADNSAKPLPRIYWDDGTNTTVHTGSTSLTVGTWYLMEYHRDPSTPEIRAFVNGTADGTSNTTTGGNTDNAGVLQIGVYDDTRHPADLTWAEIAHYQRSTDMTADELASIRDYFNSGHGLY